MGEKGIFVCGMIVIGVLSSISCVTASRMEPLIRENERLKL